jgi:hypothetical protein
VDVLNAAVDDKILAASFEFLGIKVRTKELKEIIDGLRMDENSRRNGRTRAVSKGQKRPKRTGGSNPLRSTNESLRTAGPVHATPRASHIARRVVHQQTAYESSAFALIQFPPALPAPSDGIVMVLWTTQFFED